MKYVIPIISALGTAGIAALPLAATHAPIAVCVLTFLITFCKSLADIWSDSPNPVLKTASAFAGEIATELKRLESEAEVQPNAVHN